MIVVDASLAAKWVIEEVGTPEALQLLENPASDLAAPDLILVEVAGAIIRRANMKVLAPSDAAAAISRWHGIVTSGALDLHDVTPSMMMRATSLALELGHPVKDCFYAALAVENDRALATCDLRFTERLRKVHAQTFTLAELASRA